MFRSLSSAWLCYRSDHRGFCSGTSLLVILMLCLYNCGIQASLTVGPGGDFPRVSDVLLYAISHDELPALLFSVILLVSVGRFQERRWGTVPFLALSALTVTILPFLYTLLLFVGSGEATRICGHSAIQLTLFTAQCRQETPRRLPRCLPAWFLPWLLLLMAVLLLPGTPVLLHFCSLFIGHNCILFFLMSYFCISVRLWLEGRGISRKPFLLIFCNVSSCHSSRSLPQRTPVDQAAAAPVREAAIPNLNTLGTAHAWETDDSADVSETQLLEEQMLRAGILASVRDAPDFADAKVEVPKSSVSSLRLQQLEKMGFSTEKAVVALAASKQLDGAISLLVDEGVGEQAVVV
ncbi:unnamed protein product, partial [Tetraodon nigroviridis]